MKKLLALLLTLIMLLSTLLLAGCGDKDDDDKKSKKDKDDTSVSDTEDLSDEEIFVGKWETEMDLTDLINEQFAGDEEMGEYLEIEEFILTINFEFDEDGNYSIEADDDACKDALKGIQKDFKKGMEKYIEDLGMTIDEFEEALGGTLDDLVEEAFGDEALDEILEGFISEGKYKVDDGKLFTTDDEDADFDEDEYEEYKIVDNDEIKITGFVSDDIDEEDEVLYDQILPMILKRK